MAGIPGDPRGERRKIVGFGILVEVIAQAGDDDRTSTLDRAGGIGGSDRIAEREAHGVGQALPPTTLEFGTRAIEHRCVGDTDPMKSEVARELEQSVEVLGSGRVRRRWLGRAHDAEA